VINEDHGQREAAQCVHAQIARKLGPASRDLCRFAHVHVFGVNADPGKRDTVKHA
jgi:hypothetical protein